MDNYLDKFSFTAKNKNTIYMILAAILNLGNVQFETAANDESFINVETRIFLYNSAALLNINEMDLEDALISHTREVNNQKFK